ncbi:MAG: hypothetical protein PHZ26_02315 [Candidatus Gracilibacteria bacterium]|nr:hypothetical protein [Candidatus Gracilibacteria bacterium]MDD2908569.1 hypothetical protein [Candidatus Gracilibacteria bacterium]
MVQVSSTPLKNIQRIDDISPEMREMITPGFKVINNTFNFSGKVSSLLQKGTYGYYIDNFKEHFESNPEEFLNSDLDSRVSIMIYDFNKYKYCLTPQERFELETIEKQLNELTYRIGAFQLEKSKGMEKGIPKIMNETRGRVRMILAGI